MKKLSLSAAFFLLIHWIVVAQTAPDFTVTDAHGNVHRLYQDYLNQGKTVVLELFFTTCPPCNAIAPQVEQLYRDWGSGGGDVEFIALSTLASDTDAKVRNYESQHNHTFPAVSPQGGSLTANQPYRDGTFGLYFGTPTFVVIAPNKSVNYDVRGNGMAGTIQAIDAAIAATGAVKTTQFSEISGIVTTFKGRPIPGVRVSIWGQPDLVDSTDETGHFSITMEIREGVEYELNAEKSGAFTSGITTLDLVLLKKHVLKVDTFKSLFQLYMADANLNHAISTIDIVQFTKLVLRVQTTLPNRQSPWLFLNALADFDDYYTNPSGVFGIPFNSDSNLDQLNFVGIKSGDLNDSSPLD